MITQKLKSEKGGRIWVSYIHAKKGFKIGIVEYKKQ